MRFADGSLFCERRPDAFVRGDVNGEGERILNKISELSFNVCVDLMTARRDDSGTNM